MMHHARCTMHDARWNVHNAECKPSCTACSSRRSTKVAKQRTACNLQRPTSILPDWQMQHAHACRAGRLCNVQRAAYRTSNMRHATCVSDQLHRTKGTTHTMQHVNVQYMQPRDLQYPLATCNAQLEQKRGGTACRRTVAFAIVPPFMTNMPPTMFTTPPSAACAQPIQIAVSAYPSAANRR